MIWAQTLVAAFAAATGAGTAPQGLVPPVLTPLPPRLQRPVRTPLPADVDLGARLVRSAMLRDGPGGTPVARVGIKTEFGSQRVLPVVRREGEWLGVIATERPNGTLGWLPADAVRLVEEPVRLRVDLSERSLRVVRAGRTVAHMTVGIGSSSTPTPTGEFAVTDGIRGWGPYGCCILALSGHQPKLAQGWTGGDRLAVHGTPAGRTVGSAASLGCLRADDRDLRVLLRAARLGARVRIAA
jgi:lipoprotein-anchoring transpeptidase ErfK/SrfK